MGIFYIMKNQIDKIPFREENASTIILHTYYLLFINTKSGNKQGLKYCQFSGKKLKYIFGNEQVSYVQFFDLFDPRRSKLGFEYAKKLVDAKNDHTQVRLIICGGDGTISWVLSLASQTQIDFEKVLIGILPIGTGNDFSRSVGWGHKSVEFCGKNFSQLHSLVKQWNKAHIGYYDIWDIQIETSEGGGFYQIKNQTQVKKQGKLFKRSFTNYFGIGLDGRIVYSVEKNRGSNAFINKLLYTVVGAKKLFQSLENITDTISYVREYLQFSFLSEQLISSSEQPMMTKEESIGNQDIDELKEKSWGQKQNKVEYKLQNGYKGLVCLNCTSYMCGLRNVWMTKKSTDKKIDLSVNKSSQKYDDGKLQFMSFNNELTLALERIFRTGVRIGQGNGPFQIKFKQKREPTTTYMQIDGQSVKISNISSIKVRKSEAYPGGRIRVLIKNQD